MGYYYLVASLPPVKLGEPAPVAAQDFLESCQGQVSEPDLRDMTRIVAGEDQQVEHPALRRYFDGETQLRNTLVRDRASTHRSDAQPFLRDTSGDISAEAAAQQALGIENPLERELFLDRFRWSRLEDMAIADMFGAPVLFAFLLQLRIAQRWEAMTVEAGQSRVNEILQQHTQDVCNHLLDEAVVAQN